MTYNERDKPYRTYGARVLHGFGYCVGIGDFFSGTCRDGFFKEHGDAWEVFKNLHLNITTRLQGTAEHGWTADYDGTGSILGLNSLRKAF